MQYNRPNVRRKQSFESLALSCAAKRHTAPEIPGGFALPRLRHGTPLRSEVLG